MKTKVKDIIANPYRHIEKYPIRRDKVDALKQSIGETGFWDNLIGRRSPTEKGKIEIAYGHHRITALRECDVETIDIPIRKLDELTMIRMMAAENLEEWGSSASVITETVLAVIQAAAAGIIELPKMGARSNNPNQHLRFEDFGCICDDSESSQTFTPLQIAETLGQGWWNATKEGKGKEAVHRLRTALSILQAEHAGTIKADTFSDDVSVTAAAKITKAAKAKMKVEESYINNEPGLKESERKERIRKAKARVKKAAEKVAKQVGSGETSTREAGIEFEKAMDRPKKAKELPDIVKACSQICGDINNQFRAGVTLHDKVSALIGEQGFIPEYEKKQLKAELEAFSDRVLKLADKIK